MPSQSGSQKNSGRDPGTIHNRKTKPDSGAGQKTPDSGTGQKAPAGKSSDFQKQPSGQSKK